MARIKKQKAHLKRLNTKERAKKVEIVLRGSLVQRMQKRKGISIIVLDEEKLFVNNVEPFHLDKILKLLRERNWDYINERILGVLIFLLLKSNGVRRKKITETLNLIEGISYLTAELCL